MRHGLALWCGLALAALGCETSRTPLVGLTESTSGSGTSGASTTSTGGTGSGTSTGGTTSSSTSSGNGTSSGSSGGTSGTTGTTTGANHFSCDLGDGGLFGAAYTIDAGVGPTYVLASEAGGHPLALGDTNGDGDLDILLGDAFSGNVGLLLGNGDGTFQDTQRTQISGTIGELFIATVGHPSQKVALVQGGPVFTEPQVDFLQIGKLGATNVLPSITSYYAPIAVVDLDGDGWPDMLAASTDVVLFRGGPNGFSETPLVLISSVGFSALADFNEDGNLDLLVSKGSMTQVFTGNSDGTFTAGDVVENAGFRILVGDVNADGHLDLISDVPGTHDYVELLGTGSGSFTRGPILPAQCDGTFLCDTLLSLVDLNGDGHLDLVSATFARSADTWVLKFAFGNGDGTFQPGLTDPSIPSGSFAFGDVNGDGHPNLIAAHVTDGNLDIRLSNCR